MISWKKKAQKEKIGVFKKYVTSQYKALRILKYYYGKELEKPTKQHIASELRKMFPQYKDIKNRDKVIQAFCNDNKDKARAVKERLEEVSQEIIKRREERKEKRPFTLEEYHIKTEEFYKSSEWRKVRYEVLREQGGRCQCCGRTAKDGVILHVDHIIPLSKDWSKRLDKDNLQVLCEDCNIGKSNTDKIDWRI